MRSTGTSATPAATALAAVLVFAGALAFYVGFSDYGFHREDEGSLLLQFWRWSSGEVPYRDFHVGYTPGVYIVHKTLMDWFGPGLMPGRHLLAIVNSLSATLLFLLTARLTSSWKWSLLPPLLYVSAVPVYAGDFAAFNIPYPTWYNLLVFALGAMLLPGLGAGPAPARLLACGVLAGIAFTFKPNVGLFQLAASALVCLHAYGRPRSRFEHGLWWTWWSALLLGLLVVFSSAPTLRELAGFLAPATAAAMLVARDCHRTPPREEVGAPSLLTCGLVMAAGFLAVCVPWLAWAYSILGPEWFARRALFLGAGFESVYYLSSPSQAMAAAALAAGAAAWFLPGWLERRRAPAWPLPLAGAAIGVVAFAYLAATRPMPEGLYAAVMSVVEPGVFTVATFVQWALLLLWLARPVTDGRARLLAASTICGAMLYLQIFPRTDLMHWVSAAPLLFPPAVWLLQSLAQRFGDGRGALVRGAVGVAIALPLIAVALLRVGHFLDARWDVVDGRLARTPETPLAVAHAPVSINVGQAEIYRDLEATVAYVTAHSAPDEPVFTFPILDYVSYFSLRRPGNRHGYYFPGWPGHDTEVEVLAALERRPPRLAVTIYEHRLYFASASAYYFLFADFFESRYRRVARLGPYAILAETGAADPIRPDESAARISSASVRPTAIADALGAGGLQAIRDALASPDVDARLRAIAQMAEWKIVGDFEPMRAALVDADPRVRSAAVRAIPRTIDPAMRAALLAGVAGRAFSTTDSVLAIRAARIACDASCVSMLLPVVGGDDLVTGIAARGALAELPILRWLSDYWWKWDGEGRAPFAEPTRSLLVAALRDAGADPQLRSLAFAYADRLDLGRCPRPLRRWARRPLADAGIDSTVSTALHQLSRESCRGPWLAAAIDRLQLDPTLAPRIVLREARKDTAGADAGLAATSLSRLGTGNGLPQWLCGVVGSDRCLAAVRSTLADSPSEAERVAAAWSWSQLAKDDSDIADLLARVARDASPQVRESAGYGLERRRLHEQQATSPR